MAKVDPLTIPVPQGIHPELDPYLITLDRFLKALWERTGGGDDLIEKSDISLSAPDKPHEHDLDDIARLHFGSGVPIASLGNTGDYYFREDGGASTRLYHKTSGTWTAFA